MPNEISTIFMLFVMFGGARHLQSQGEVLRLPFTPPPNPLPTGVERGITASGLPSP